MGKKLVTWGGVMQLSNDTSKNSTSPPYLVKNERSLRTQAGFLPLLIKAHITTPLKCGKVDYPKQPAALTPLFLNENGPIFEQREKTDMSATFTRGEKLLNCLFHCFFHCLHLPAVKERV